MVNNKVVPEGTLLIERLKHVSKRNGKVDLAEFKQMLGKEHSRKRNPNFFKNDGLNEAEELFAMHLKRHDIDFVREYRVEGFHADFMIVGYGVLVEIDGGCHFTNNKGRFSKKETQHNYDRERRFVIVGWRVIRYTSWEVAFDPETSVRNLILYLDWLDENKPLIQTVVKEKVVEKEVEVEVEKVKEVVKEIGKPLEDYSASLLVKHLLRRILRK